MVLQWTKILKAITHWVRKKNREGVLCDLNELVPPLIAELIMEINSAGQNSNDHQRWRRFTKIGERCGRILEETSLPQPSIHGQNASDGKARDTPKEVGKVWHPNLHKLLVWKSNQETMEDEAQEGQSGEQVENWNRTRTMYQCGPTGVKNTRSDCSSQGLAYQEEVSSCNNSLWITSVHYHMSTCRNQQMQKRLWQQRFCSNDSRKGTESGFKHIRRTMEDSRRQLSCK